MLLKSVEIKGLFKSWPNTTRSGSDITLQFSDQANVIIGANGTGKTTTLKLLHQFFRSTSQQIKDTNRGGRRPVIYQDIADKMIPVWVANVKASMMIDERSIRPRAYIRFEEPHSLFPPPEDQEGDWAKQARTTDWDIKEPGILHWGKENENRWTIEHRSEGGPISDEEISEFYNRLLSSDFLWNTPFTHLVFTLDNGLNITVTKHEDYLDFNGLKPYNFRLFQPSPDRTEKFSDGPAAEEYYVQVFSRFQIHFVPVNRMVRIEESDPDESKMVRLLGEDEIRSLFLDGQGVKLDVIPEVCHLWKTEAEEMWKDGLVGLSSSLVSALDKPRKGDEPVPHLPGALNSAQIKSITNSTNFDRISEQDIRHELQSIQEEIMSLQINQDVIAKSDRTDDAIADRFTRQKVRLKMLEEKLRHLQASLPPPTEENDIEDPSKLLERTRALEALGISMEGLNNEQMKPWVSDIPKVELTTTEFLYDLAGPMKHLDDFGKRQHRLAVEHLLKSVELVEAKSIRLSILKEFIDEFYEGKYCVYENGFEIKLPSRTGDKLALDDTLSLSLLSSGEKHTLIMMMSVLHGDPNSMIMIDEPETSLHIEWQEMLLPWLMKAANAVNSSILITTHSPHLMSDHDCNVIMFPMISDADD